MTPCSLVAGFQRTGKTASIHAVKEGERVDVLSVYSSPQHQKEAAVPLKRDVLVPLDQGRGSAGLDDQQMIKYNASAGKQSKFPRPSIALCIGCH